MFDVYDSQVAHMPDVISTATSPTVSVALSPKDNLTAGGECATDWVLTSAQKCWSVVQHLCASGPWELHLHCQTCLHLWRSANGDQARRGRQQLRGGLSAHSHAAGHARCPRHDR